jgi:hypothetical protein
LPFPCPLPPKKIAIASISPGGKTGREATAIFTLLAQGLCLYCPILDNKCKRKNPKLDIFFAENINMKIEGFTVQELANTLNISYNTAHKRLERLGIQPLTTGAIYPKSALEAIRNVPSKGRPPKGKPEPKHPEPEKRRGRAISEA